MLRLISSESFAPLLFGLAAAVDRTIGVCAGFIGHQELRVGWPAVTLLGQAYLVIAERFSVGGRRVLFVWRAPGYVAVDDDEGGPFGFFKRCTKRAVEQIGVVGIADAQNIPVIRAETGRHIITKSKSCVALDSDVIVVVDPDKVAELEMSGQGCGLL